MASADWSLRNPAWPFPLSPHSPAPHSLPLTSTCYWRAERFLNLTVTQSLFPSIVTALQESIPIPPFSHALLSLSQILLLCSFPCLQRQEREEGQQRAKSTRAESGDRGAVWVWSLMCMTLGKQYRFLSGHRCCHLQTELGAPRAETQCHMLCRYWCHEDAKNKSVLAFTNLLSNVIFFMTHTHIYSDREIN